MKSLKTVCVSGVFLLGGLVSFAEAQDQKEDTAVIGGIYTGEDAVATPQKPRVKRDYVVKQTFRQKVGNRSVTIQEVEPPVEEPKPEKNLPEDRETDKQVISVKPEAYASPQFIVVTGTVYGKGKDTRSKITLWHDNKKCVALTRADFRIMSGFTQFKANGRPYFILENIVDADAPGIRAQLISSQPIAEFHRGVLLLPTSKMVIRNCVKFLVICTSCIGWSNKTCGVHTKNAS